MSKTVYTLVILSISQIIKDWQKMDLLKANWVSVACLKVCCYFFISWQKVYEETGKLISSLMVHPEKTILLFLRLYNLEDRVEIYDLQSRKPGGEIQGKFRGDASAFSTFLLR